MSTGGGPGRVVMRGFKTLITAEEAVSIVMREVPLIDPGVEEVGLQDSLGRYAGRDVYAVYDVPPFDRAAVDGYAVRSSDVYSASPTNPVELRLVGRLAAGSSPAGLSPLREGEAVKIFTGAPVPPGADAVVRAEDAREEGDRVFVYRPVAPLQNISRRGEDFRRGDIVLRRGERIRPWHIGALASQNISSVPVFRRLRIGVLSTGSELREVGEEVDFERGQVVNSSKPMLLALIREEGCEPVDLGTVPDDIRLIRERVLMGLEKTDILITTGGTSVGEEDLVPEAIGSIEGSRILFHGVRIRPGRPVGLALVRNRPVFMFSGFPVSALVEFQLLVRPLIKRMYSAREEPRPTVRGRLVRRVANPPSTRSFVRVRVYRRGGGVYIEPLALTGSGLLSTLVRGNAILVVREDMEGYDEGEEVEVEVIGYIDES